MRYQSQSPPVGSRDNVSNAFCATCVLLIVLSNCVIPSLSESKPCTKFFISGTNIDGFKKILSLANTEENLQKSDHYWSHHTTACRYATLWNISVSFWILIFTRLCSEPFEVRWDLQGSLTVTVESSSERILKIGQYLMKLWSYQTWWLTFMDHPAYEWNELVCLTYSLIQAYPSPKKSSDLQESHETNIIFFALYNIAKTNTKTYLDLNNETVPLSPSAWLSVAERQRRCPLGDITVVLCQTMNYRTFRGYVKSTYSVCTNLVIVTVEASKDGGVAVRRWYLESEFLWYLKIFISPYGSTIRTNYK